MKIKVMVLSMICLLIFPTFSYASQNVNGYEQANTQTVEAVLTDENGNQLILPVTVSEPVREMNNGLMTLDGIQNNDVKSYSQDFSITIDEEAIEDAVTRAGGSYSDTTYDSSMTLKLWGRIYYDTRIAYENGIAKNTYCVTQMEGHFKNIQPERLDLINQHVVVACTNDFNQSSAQHVEWWTGDTFNNYTGFQYYAFADRPFSAIGGSMSCQGRTSDGHTWDVYLSLPIAGTNVLPGI